MIMETKILSEIEVREASNILKEGGLVAFPTETVYGIGCVATSEEAFLKLVKAKNRRPDQPFTLMCSSIEEALGYIDVTPSILRVMNTFMPGPLTVLVKPVPNLPYWIGLGSEYIGIRIPDSELVLDLIKYTEAPLLVPSANKTGEKTSTEFEEVKSVFFGEIEAIIQGECRQKSASTIVMFEPNGNTRLIREGAISLDDIKTVYNGGRYENLIRK